MTAWVDNKQLHPLNHYLPLYRALEPAEVCARCGVTYDAGAFQFNVLGTAMRAVWPEYRLLFPQAAPQTEEPARTRPAARLLYLRYLLEGKDLPGTGKFLTYRETPWGSVYDANFQGRCIKRLAYAFGPRPADFARAMERLGAEKIRMGECAYEVAFLGNHRLRIALWAGDEEFPPAAQILFSDDFTFAFSAEDLAVVGDVLIDTLKEESAR